MSAARLLRELGSVHGQEALRPSQIHPLDLDLPGDPASEIGFWTDTGCRAARVAGAGDLDHGEGVSADHSSELTAARDALGREDYERAKELLEPIAAQGDPEALFQLLFRAAELGSAAAQYTLGASYGSGDWGSPFSSNPLGGPKDDVEARRWYVAMCWLEAAGAHGAAEAMRLLADLYEGNCEDWVPDLAPNPERAAEWRRRFEEA